MKVEDFGKIKQAEIQITPFMLFVGENNSGKSYILELLWGIFNNLETMITDHMFNDPEFNQLALDVRKELQHIESSNQPITYPISHEIQAKLLNIFNKALAEKKSWLMKKIFNHNVEIAHLEINRDRFFDLKIEITKEKILMKEPENDTDTVIERSREVLFYRLEFNQNDRNPEPISQFATGKQKDLNMISKWLLWRIIETLICVDYTNIKSRRKLNWTINEPIYFPASRTGFMHTYQTILANDRKELYGQLTLFDLLEEENAEKPQSNLRLTTPVQDFLEKLAELHLDDDQQQLYKNEIEFLNENIFHGSVTRDATRNYRFVPKGKEQEEVREGLPLHVTSSLVAELAPISIFLASQYDPKLFIIEEAESHLHVKKQLELVRLFFRLINKGKSIWLTTHSDSFAQQINNLLTLSQHPKKEELFSELGYEELDTLNDISQSSCYQFNSVDGKTIVEKLELGPYGFVMPVFNQTLEKLLIETSKIQTIEDEHD